MKLQKISIIQEKVFKFLFMEINYLQMKLKNGNLNYQNMVLLELNLY